MPLFWLSSAFMVGLALGASLAWGWPAWAALAAICVLLALVERRFLFSRAPWYPAWLGVARLPLALVVAALALGGLRWRTSQPVWGEGDLAWYNGRGAVRLVGVIQQPPERNERSQSLVVAVEQLEPLDGGPTRAVRGLALARLALGETWNYGDRLELQGRLAAPAAQAEFDYPAYLARREIYSELSYPQAHRLARDAGSFFWALVYDLRGAALQVVNRLLPQPESALLAGILLGSDRDLPAGVVRAFQDTGTAHIIAVSGFNIAIVSGLLAQTLGRLLRARFALPLTLVALAGYALLTGGSPSVVRAAIMGSFSLFGPPLGRRQVGINTLALTAGGMCLFDPGLPWDISFQLSFAATLGLVLYAEPLQQGFTGLLERRLPAPLARQLAGPIGEYFLFTLAAQVFTLPVTVLHFGRVSLSAVLANPLVLPVQPLAMLLGAAALGLGLAFLPLGQLVAWLCWPLLAYTIRTAELLARLPYGVFDLAGIAPGLVALYYALLLGLAFPWLRRQARRAWKPAVGLVLAGLLAAGLWRSALSAPDGRLHLEVFNLPGGPAVLLRSPSGQAWLINGSSQADALADAVGRRLPPLTGRLEGVLLTAPSAAPLAGLEPLLVRYPPRLLAASPRLPESAALRRLSAQVESQGGQAAALPAGAAFDLGGGVVLRTLAGTHAGAAVWLEWGRFRALLPYGVALQDLDADARAALAGVSFLLLETGQNAQAWQQAFQPLAAAAPGIGRDLPVGWLDLAEGLAEISLVTDGAQVWISRQDR